MFKLKKILILAVLVNSLSAAAPAFAKITVLSDALDPVFNPNFLIADEELSNAQAMSQVEIAAFFKNKSGVLGQYEIIDPATGLNKTVAELIFEAAQNHKINPQVLVTLLQKEQSLVENPSPTQYNFDWAAGYGRCDACDVNDPAVAKFKGLAKQIDSAGGAFRYFLDNPDLDWLKKPGLLYNIDAVPVIPANRATAFLYTYTPHLEGNYNFWKIWQRYFAKIFPDGAVALSIDDGKIWLIQNGKKHLFANRAAFLSRYEAKNILKATADELKQYPDGPSIKYPNFALLENKRGEIYLIIKNKKRLVKKGAFRYYGFNPDEVIKVEESDLQAFSADQPLTIKTKYPRGLLTRDKKSDQSLVFQNSFINQ